MQITTLSIFHFTSWVDRIWAFAQMGLARSQMSKTQGLHFWKLCGSGTGEGFTPLPNLGAYAILCVWDDLETAQNGVTQAVHATWRRRASQVQDIFLSPISARGVWAGRAPFDPQPPLGGPIAALTRATVKPQNVLKFWRRVPNISRAIGANSDVLFKIGIGEVPWVHQVTFSIWPNSESMAAFARKAGPHADAIRAVRQEDWFAEELYARFNVIGEVPPRG